MKKNSSAFRPSSISRYIHCNLWRWLPQEGKTPHQLAYLQEGTNNHARLEQERFNENESNCQAYFERVKESCIYFFKEQTLEMEMGDEVLEGTPDVYGYDESCNTLHIIDYKTGRSYVRAENNEQLLAYAMLVMNRHDDWKIEKIELAILNTQHDGVNHHVYMGTLYVESLKKRIEKALEKNFNEESFGKPGSWCTFCPSKRYCMRKKGYHILKDYGDLDTDQLILESKKRSREILSREREIKEGAHSQILGPFVFERTKRSWKEGIDLPEGFYSLKPMSISQAEKTFSKDMITDYTQEKKYRVLNFQKSQTR